ncbi:hypothetical protein HORIV_57530 [Vreelandella olivaria]|uniref:GGDEF domain-containing protein n=1 Tax=Vreelandella olivaria TaxID=390919 RepID=A0ABM7GRJ2_9GAMM|nr:hypothetical protein HORIV_57530 [Halomonas olivaria]
MIIGDAILSLSKSQQKLPDFQAIEQMSRQRSGSLTRIAIALMTFRDAEKQRREAECKVHRLAYFDTLTQLPNWQLMREHLQHSLDTSQQTETYGALIYLDVDDFNRINDSCGHRMGDNLLQQIAERLTGLKVEGITMGRLGGDEFMVIIDGLASEQLEAAEKAEAFAEQLQRTLSPCYWVEDKSIFLV